jgi:hypothetical protein
MGKPIPQQKKVNKIPKLRGFNLYQDSDIDGNIPKRYMMNKTYVINTRD